MPLNAPAAVNGYGAVTEYPAAADADGITTGVDGNIWYTANLADEVVKVDPATGSTLATYAVPAPCGPLGITIGPDRNVWVACYRGDSLVRATANGHDDHMAGHCRRLCQRQIPVLREAFVVGIRGGAAIRGIAVVYLEHAGLPAGSYQVAVLARQVGSLTSYDVIAV